MDYVSMLKSRRGVSCSASPHGHPSVCDYLLGAFYVLLVFCFGIRALCLLPDAVLRQRYRLLPHQVASSLRYSAQSGWQTNALKFTYR
ncbi:unnamed protein product [Arctogadus glacialis]